MIDHSYPIPSRIAEFRVSYHISQQNNADKLNYWEHVRKTPHTYKVYCIKFTHRYTHRCFVYNEVYLF